MQNGPSDNHLTTTTHSPWFASGVHACVPATCAVCHQRCMCRISVSVLQGLRDMCVVESWCSGSIVLLHPTTMLCSSNYHAVCRVT